MAVYTHLNTAETEAILDAYDIGPLENLTPIAEGVENTNYRLDTKTGPYILTLFEKRVDPDDVPYFMDLTAHLAHKGLAVPKPISMTNGETIGTVKGRKAVIIEFLQGAYLKRYEAPHIAQLGAALAQLHAAGADFKGRRTNGLGPAGCKALLETITRAERQAEDDTIFREMDTMAASILDSWPQDLPQGPIHADLFPDNVFFDPRGRLSGMIDFYFACHDALAYDLAVCLNAWCYDGNNAYRADWGKALIESYQKHRPLSEAEAGAFPALARSAALRFLLTRLHDRIFHDPNAIVTPKDPTDYILRLRHHAEAEDLNFYLA